MSLLIPKSFSFTCVCIVSGVETEEEPSLDTMSESDDGSGVQICRTNHDLPFLIFTDDEVWDNTSDLEVEYDFSQAENPPASPRQDTTASAMHSSENILLHWLLLFLLRLQGRHYVSDAAINSLLKFLYLFLHIIGRHSQFVAHMANCFPKSLHQVRKYFGLRENFSRFVVCKKCYNVYTFDRCIEKHGTELSSRICTY